MKIFVFVLHLVILLFGCKVEPERNAGFKMNAEAKEISERPFANPVNIYGSSFGQYFQALYRNNQYQTMCLFTSNLQRESMGDDSLFNYYKNEFELDYNLGRLSNIQYLNDTFQLTFANASLYATRTKVIIYCAIENDTTKFICLTN